MKRSVLHKSFVTTFDSSDTTCSLPTVGELEAIEASLGITFPKSYVEFITNFGAIYTPSILDLVTGGESEEAPPGASFDIQNFLKIDEIEDTSNSYWDAGMENTIVPIASDSMGNLFCFGRVVSSRRSDDSKVFVFDHDYCEVEEEYSTFDGWLSSFLTMKTALA
ncbi:SMI1/KNR4 family protein [Rubritalea sp.]|uniref:SMI1/KNR4 family protein n=1 Tax=Rubritalea sp. TaxID=2109375 RepID=UPI003EF6B869